MAISGLVSEDSILVTLVDWLEIKQSRFSTHTPPPHRA
ncbi:MAG: hypothetical protein ACI9TP_002366, partial [Candidatus Azotimanducaceae bacterium]